MYGKGFLTHLGKDRFEVSNVGVGREFKKVQIKLLKKDMQDILKKYGRNNKGNKDEVIRKFVEFAKKVPKLFNPRLQAQPQAQPEFIPLEEATPQFQSKNIKITPFIPLEEAMPQFQSKNIKIKKKLPPLISAREEELYKLKIPELKQMIKEKKMKPGNKEQMIKQILKSENIEEGVRWDDKWLYKDLVRQHYVNEANGSAILDNSPSIENLERQIKFLENKLKNTEFPSGFDGRTRRRLLQDQIQFYKNKLQEIKTLMSRDLQKEYDANVKEREEKSKRYDEARRQERLQAEFIPLEEAMPQFQSKNIKQ